MGSYQNILSARRAISKLILGKGFIPVVVCSHLFNVIYADQQHNFDYLPFYLYVRHCFLYSLTDNAADRLFNFKKSLV